jgi:hypothetical protein
MRIELSKLSKVVGVTVLGVIILGVVVNSKDLVRYMKLSMM